MPTRPYSIDLRKRVIEYISLGNSRKKISEVFAVHVNTVNRWWSRYQREGIYTARKRQGAKRRVNRDEVRIFFENKPDSTKKLGRNLELVAGK